MEDVPCPTDTRSHCPISTRSYLFPLIVSIFTYRAGNRYLNRLTRRRTRGREYDQLPNSRERTRACAGPLRSYSRGIAEFSLQSYVCNSKSHRLPPRICRYPRQLRTNVQFNISRASYRSRGFGRYRRGDPFNRFFPTVALPERMTLLIRMARVDGRSPTLSRRSRDENSELAIGLRPRRCRRSRE